MMQGRIKKQKLSGRFPGSQLFAVAEFPVTAAGTAPTAAALGVAAGAQDDHGGGDEGQQEDEGQIEVFHAALLICPAPPAADGAPGPGGLCGFFPQD